MELVKTYQWNNFLQLKVINICTEVIENSDNAEFRKQFLTSSGIAKALVEMSEKAFIQMESERQIRNGYMALVVSVSNKLQNRYTEHEKLEDEVVKEYIDETGEEWRAFVDGELKSSNENNNKTLGGCTTRNNMSEENEEENSNYDVQMEKIMARFTNFNQILSQNSGNDDDDDDDDEDTQEYIKDDNEEETKDKKEIVSDYNSEIGVKVHKVDLKEK